MAYITNLDNNLDDIYDAWDEPATPVAQPIPVIDPNGWHWYPDSNGQLFTLYYDADGNECMMWQLQHDGSFHWRCAGVGYTCRDIGIDGRRGIFFQNLFVGSMLLDEHLTVTWLPETYIQYDNIETVNHDNVNDYIQYMNNINHNDYEVNDITDITDSEEDDTNDE